LGVVFYPPSPRAVDLSAAREISAAAGPFVNIVALFVNPGVAEVEEVIARVRPDLLQFHGDESPAFCEQFGVPYMKAIRVGGVALESNALAVHPAARGLLLDTLDAQRHGGTGRRFDWSLVPADSGRALVVAGGLDPANVDSAIRAMRPWAVDVSSGVERIPGRKDRAKIEEFMRAVARANAADDRPSAGADVE
jgi:phosphoribosylanthranilate isomerase